MQLPVETHSLRIRPFTVQDAAAVFVLSNEETVRTWLPSQVYHDFTQALSTIENLISGYSFPGHPRHGPYVLAIELRADSVLIGHVGLSPLGDDVEIGFAIAQKYQNRGFATDAVTAVSRWAFQTFHLNRIIGITSAANMASKRVLERAQFIREENRMMVFQGLKQEVNIYALYGYDVHDHVV